MSNLDRWSVLAACLTALIVSPLAAPLPARAATAEKGILWEQTVEMTSSGFSMPPNSSSFCASRKQWTEPPRQKDDQDCKVKDFRNNGGRMTWKMECTGRERMTGEGEIVHTGDSYTGQMKMHSSHGDMLMKMRGRKLGGECEVGVVEIPTGAPGGGTRKVNVEEMQRQNQQAMKQYEQAQADAVAANCKQAIKELNAQLMTMEHMGCKDPAWKGQFCARLATVEGIATLDRQDEQSRQAAAKLCGKDLAAVSQELCPKALEEGATDHVGKYCPAESRTLAQRECAGRSYTTMPQKYRTFCTKYARASLDSKPAGQPQPEAKPADDSPAERAKKAAKGFLKF